MGSLTRIHRGALFGYTGVLNLVAHGVSNSTIQGFPKASKGLPKSPHVDRSFCHIWVPFASQGVPTESYGLIRNA